MGFQSKRKSLLQYVPLRTSFCDFCLGGCNGQSSDGCESCGWFSTCDEQLKCCSQDVGPKLCSECCQDSDCPSEIGMICIDNKCEWDNGNPQSPNFLYNP